MAAIIPEEQTSTSSSYPEVSVILSQKIWRL